jgi:hypothetical protein
VYGIGRKQFVYVFFFCNLRYEGCCFLYFFSIFFGAKDFMYLSFFVFEGCPNLTKSD